MPIVNIYEAKTHLSRLIQAVLDGDEVIIARANKPVARLVRIGTERPRREIGFARHLVSVGDDFDDPLEEFEEYR